jgi:hypothetical protein
MRSAASPVIPTATTARVPSAVPSLTPTGRSMNRAVAGRDRGMERMALSWEGGTGPEDRAVPAVPALSAERIHLGM